MEEKKFEFDERAPYAYFQNTACPYFPCHAKANREFFNCLFCYCPLYALGEDCGGNFTYYKGVKDCTDCLIPHSRNAYDYITSRFGELVVLAQEKKPVDSPEKI